MKTAISVPDETFARVEAAAAKLGVSRSEFFSKAAERWIAELADHETTAAIDAVVRDLADDGTDAPGAAGSDEAAFRDGAARRTFSADTSW